MNLSVLFVVVGAHGLFSKINQSTNFGLFHSSLSQVYILYFFLSFFYDELLRKAFIFIEKHLFEFHSVFSKSSLISRDHEPMHAYLRRTSLFVPFLISCNIFFLLRLLICSLKCCSRHRESKENREKRERMLRRTAILVLSPMNVFLLSLLCYIFFSCSRIFSPFRLFLRTLSYPLALLSSSVSVLLPPLSLSFSFPYSLYD